MKRFLWSDVMPGLRSTAMKKKWGRYFAAAAGLVILGVLTGGVALIGAGVIAGGLVAGRQAHIAYVQHQEQRPVQMSRSQKMNSPLKWAMFGALALAVVGLGVATGGLGFLAAIVVVGAIIGGRAAHIAYVKRAEEAAREKRLHAETPSSPPDLARGASPSLGPRAAASTKPVLPVIPAGPATGPAGPVSPMDAYPPAASSPPARSDGAAPVAPPVAPGGRS